VATENWTKNLMLLGKLKRSSTVPRSTIKVNPNQYGHELMSRSLLNKYRINPKVKYGMKIAIPPTLGTILVCDDLELGRSTRPRVVPKSMNNLANSMTAAINGGTNGYKALLKLLGFWIGCNTKVQS
jgi:hypothetical protein